MVKVQITRNRDGRVLTFLADGHAASSRRRTEYDLVCAALSAVMQTALLGLGEYVGLHDRLTYNIDDDGWLYCQLPADLSDAERVRADAIIETMIIGLRSIASEYPEQITVEEEVE
jgi:uncharacterized protein YsxB (DUF464 family)